MLSFFDKKKEDKNKEIAINPNNIPQHIAIIMDGNGRWAKARKLPRSMGHRAGVQTIEKILRECRDLGVKHLTLYAFSTENWKRPKDEVGALMNLIVEYLKNELETLHKNNVKLNIIGDISELPLFCQEEIYKACEKTKNNDKITLNVALNYGGRAEIIKALKDVIKDIENSKLNIDDINENIINKYLYTANIPDPDLIIRPSGEQRLSNFLLWQCAYSEFWYSNINWPDFKPKDLRRAIYDYQNRNRRFGGVK
ncbi:isoprenyl transferase [Clostridium tarantellae]|uniref:Isoprenyl transferase n=1 Tax=Clostridium tarantellae TaxID=39493 RepID=A0A6I1MGA4_9CLOT|nr:isoprenyl transferase [Clostridium tarantellae]MPQ42405.1 isoprenyl transferase [Clostridium tarantellae]